MAESEEELKSLLMKVKEESKKFGLKLNIQKTKIMASSPITSWQIDRETSHAAVHGAAKSWTWLSDWTELNPTLLIPACASSSLAFYMM